MSTLSGVGFELGLGIAVGMLAGTTGTRGSARGRMTLLASAVSLLLGFLLAGHASLGAPLGAFFCLLGAVFGCLVISDLIADAAGRKGRRAGALGLLVSLAALLVVVIAVAEPQLVVLAVIALAWLGISRQRRVRRAHAGIHAVRH
jgi:hypothetical protein